MSVLHGAAGAVAIFVVGETGRHVAVTAVTGVSGAMARISMHHRP